VPLRDALSLAFAAVYLFSFREATKLAAEWGAFQFKNNRVGWKKFVRCSFPLLLLAPLVMYIPFLKVVAEWRITSSAGSLLIAASVIVLLGLFPRAPKHVWSLVARRQPGEGWLNPNKVPDRDLPDPRYSWQVVFCLGMLPLLILIYTLMAGEVGILAPAGVDLRNLFVAAYGGFVHRAPPYGQIAEILLHQLKTAMPLVQEDVANRSVYYRTSARFRGAVLFVVARSCTGVKSLPLLVRHFLLARGSSVSLLLQSKPSVGCAKLGLDQQGRVPGVVRIQHMDLESLRGSGCGLRDWDAVRFNKVQI